MGARKNGKLTEKQNNFAHAVVSGLSLSDAYRDAYNADNMQPGSIRVEACNLMANPNITRTVEHLNAAKDRSLIASSVSDKQLVLESLRDWIANAENEGNRVRSAELLGKTIGLFKDVIESTPPKTMTDLDAELKAIMQDTQH